MTTNYSSISEDNIRRRGEDFDEIGRWISEQLYSDSSQFIFELLQNTQDALKLVYFKNTFGSICRVVTFTLTPDHLELSHYGKPFDEADIKGISDILHGTKWNDNQQVGRFGIGFKSVYSITNQPQIHSGDEHFALERYIRIKEIEPINLNVGETRIILPFNHPNKSPELIYNQILNSFLNFSFRDILFLDQIDKLIFRIAEGNEVFLTKSSTTISPNVNFVHLTKSSFMENSSNEETWLTLNRFVNDSNGVIKAEIAFLLSSPDLDDCEILPIDESYIYSYFRTNVRTVLKFLVQSHFETTPARDNLRWDSKRNQNLIVETALLVSDAFKILKDLNLLTPKTFEIFPLNERDFPINCHFRCFFEASKQALQHQCILPSYLGGYIKAEDARVQDSNDLCNLLASAELSELCERKAPLYWISDQFSSSMRNLISSLLSIEKITPVNFCEKITPTFLKRRNMEWLIEFYKFLKNHPYLWNQTYSWRSIIRRKPFILCQDDEFREPFLCTGDPNVFLPGEILTSYPTVHCDLLSDEEVKMFFVELNLKAPDVVDEIKSNLLPKINATMSINSYIDLLGKIFQIYQGLSISERRKLLAELKDQEIVLAENPINHQKKLMRAYCVYTRSANLFTFFEGNDAIWFISKEANDFLQLFEECGILNQVQKIVRDSFSSLVEIKKSYGDNIRGLGWFDPDWNVIGLEHALQHPSVQKSIFIWNNLLIPNKHLIRGTIEYSSLQTFSPGRVRSEQQVSRIGKILISTPWLPDARGVFHCPTEISALELPEGFILDQNLCNSLEMKNVNKNDFEETSHRGKNKFIQERYEQDPDFQAYVDRYSSSLSIKGSDENEKNVHIMDENIYSFEEALIDTFSSRSFDSNKRYPDLKPLNSNNLEHTIIGNILSEPSKSSRRTRANLIIWEEKNKQVRNDLYRFYQGRCQICQSHFIKRDGQPYFEGFYIVSRLEKRWVDYVGNVLCLCPTCCAKMMYGEIQADEDIIQQIVSQSDDSEISETKIRFRLCNEDVCIKYHPEHINILRVMVNQSKIYKFSECIEVVF